MNAQHGAVPCIVKGWIRGIVFVHLVAMELGTPKGKNPSNGDHRSPTEHFDIALAFMHVLVCWRTLGCNIKSSKELLSYLIRC